jgi:hypothetical protein
MQFRAALPVAAPKVVQRDVAQKDRRLPEATVPGRPSDRRLRVVLRTGLQFPFALARTVPARQSPDLARPGLARHKVQHAVLGEVLAAAEAMTGRVLAAMQNLADDPAQTPDRTGAAKGRVRR